MFPGSRVSWAASAPAPTGIAQTIDWNQTYFAFGAQPYTRTDVTVTYTCPPASAGKPLRTVQGGTNDEYGYSAHLCAAAVHSAANGVTSQDGKNSDRTAYAFK